MTNVNPLISNQDCTELLWVLQQSSNNSEEQSAGVTLETICGKEQDVHRYRTWYELNS